MRIRTEIKILLTVAVEHLGSAQDEADPLRVVIDRMADCEARPWGGYDRAERVRLILGRSEVLDGDGEYNFYFRTYAQSV